jgi:hypothetical protein
LRFAQEDAFAYWAALEHDAKGKGRTEDEPAGPVPMKLAWVRRPSENSDAPRADNPSRLAYAGEIRLELVHDASHWAHYSTDALRQLLTSLEAMKQAPRLTIAGVKAELERRRRKARHLTGMPARRT